jgi:hypothetical protein
MKTANKQSCWFGVETVFFRASGKKIAMKLCAERQAAVSALN